jgi:membrane fusion protein (multidrug efflux system)
MLTERTADPSDEHRQADGPPAASPTVPRRRNWRRIGVIAGVVVALLAVLVFLLRTDISLALNTVSTDDAFVNSYVTYVAPRVQGQVVEVLVNDTDYVTKGQLLVRLDPTPFQVAVAQRQAALQLANANLLQAKASVRATEAMARAARYKVQNAIEQVNNQIATLHANFATYNRTKTSLSLAQANLRRGEEANVRQPNTVPPTEIDQLRANVAIAQSQVDEALENVRKVRVSLGLPPEPPDGKSYTDVPPNLAQTFSTVRSALGELAQMVAQLGVSLPASEATPDEVIEQFKRRLPSGNINEIFEQLVKTAPATVQAEAAVKQAEEDLRQAELNLSYTNIVAEISGVVNRRNVNPGNNVMVGQSLMAVRSESDLWIDANFKETQIADIRIGQPADVYVDTYGGKHKLTGKVVGFQPATGSASALLPPENATGNYVKIVQRLPVRIRLDPFNFAETPLYAGQSVVPYVYYKADPDPDVPNSGQRYQGPVGKMGLFSPTPGPAAPNAAGQLPPAPTPRPAGGGRP